MHRLFAEEVGDVFPIKLCEFLQLNNVNAAFARFTF